MEDVIHLLPDSVANQIAAGEVVQRPSSIIKEMVENSIDAGAHSIDVLVIDGGKTCVQIIDDGKGMSETDARMAFERHATSKITSASDLFRLTTMGFRGEALASIAAVAQVELKTRRPDDELGTYICMSGSKVESQEPVNCPAGSNFSVKNLFFNVPARRKFLKANQTELSNIVAEFERIALVYPDLSFTLTSNGAPVYNLPSTSVRQRILDICGKRINADLLPIEAETSLISVSGYVGKPESAKKKGVKQFFFVNGRYMRHPYFHSAVMHAYENLVPAGEHTPYFIYLSVDPSAIDVNVHPTKTEIKFDNEQAIWQVLSAVVKESLGKYCEVPTIDFDIDGKPDIPVFGGHTAIPRQPKQPTTTYNPFNTPESRYQHPQTRRWEDLYDGVQSRREYVPGADSGLPGGSPFGDEGLDGGFSGTTATGGGDAIDGAFGTADPATDIAAAQYSPSEPTLWDSKTDGGTRLVDADAESAIQCFQHKGRYIVTPVKSGLMVVDQHRAHAHVLYNKYMKEMGAVRHTSQKVLFPELVELSKAESVALEAIMDELACVGFEVTSLGGGTYSINGVPADIDGYNPPKLLQELVAAAMEHTTGIKERMREAIAQAMAEAMAVSYGQVLSPAEMGRILHDLFVIPASMRTADGRLVFTVVGNDVIDKEFK